MRLCEHGKSALLLKGCINCMSEVSITEVMQSPFRIKKWPIVASQIRLHKSRQKPFIVCCAEGIVPRFGEDGFQIVGKLSACQISGIRGEGFGKLHIKVLLTEGYPGEKMRFSMFQYDKLPSLNLAQRNLN